MKTDLFQSCGHCWVFQICWHIEYNPFTASSFRIWNSSTGIPSPPLALLVVMLPKAYLTSHSRMSGSRWVMTWLSGSWKSFKIIILCILATSSQYLLLLLGPYHFCPLLSPSLHEMYWAHLCMKCSLGISNFLEISSLSYSIFSLYFFVLITEEGFLISSCYSLELCIQMLISFLFFFAFHVSSFHNYFKVSSDNHFAFLHFFSLGMVLISASCTMSPTSIHSFSGTLSDLIPWIYLSLPLYNRNLRI